MERRVDVNNEEVAGKSVVNLVHKLRLGPSVEKSRKKCFNNLPP